MATKLKPQGFEDMFREDLPLASEPARSRAAPTAAPVHRAREAVLDTDDVQIIVYEIPDRP